MSQKSNLSSINSGNPPSELVLKILEAKAVRLAIRTASLSIVPVAVGLSLLLLYRLTANDLVVDVGMVWFVVGGLLAAIVAVLALYHLSRPRRPAPRAIIRLHRFALVQALIAPIAALFFTHMAARWYLAPHVALSATNGSSSPIDNLVIHFDSGDISVGPLQPGQTTSLGRRWIAVRGALEISVTAKGHTLRKVDRPLTDLWNEKQPFKRRAVEIIVEEAELPREARTMQSQQAL